MCIGNDVTQLGAAAIGGKALHRCHDTAKNNVGKSVHQLPLEVEKLQLNAMQN